MHSAAPWRPPRCRISVCRIVHYWFGDARWQGGGRPPSFAPRPMASRVLSTLSRFFTLDAPRPSSSSGQAALATVVPRERSPTGHHDKASSGKPRVAPLTGPNTFASSSSAIGICFAHDPCRCCGALRADLSANGFQPGHRHRVVMVAVSSNTVPVCLAAR